MPQDPTPTLLEQSISDAADDIWALGKSGYNWGPVDDLLHGALPELGTTRCKRANGSGRAANVITESNDKAIDLYVVFIGPSYSIDAFIPAATDRIKRFPKAKTVAAADRTSGMWRIRAIIEREGVGVAQKIVDTFPAVTEADLHFVPTDFDGEEVVAIPVSASLTVPRVDEDEFVSAMDSWEGELDGLINLPAQLVEFATARGVLIDNFQASDGLAAMLSSQMLLFVGPSGTGKSTVARILSEFFAPAERRFKIDALRQWLTPDDLVGYYSALSGRYVATPDTATVIEMHETSVAPVWKEGGDLHGPPILLVEEMNLSAPEGYLAPLFHGLSATSRSSINWPLHSGGTEAIDDSSVAALPETAMFGPFPRVLGTINVDASSQAPARKVAARSCVLMFEPMEITDAELAALTDSLSISEFQDDSPGEPFLGDPLGALRAAGDETAAQIRAAFVTLLGELPGLPVSRRDATRSLAYMAYYLLLGSNEAEPKLLRTAAENAFLHCVLPTVDDERFLATLQAVEKLDLTDVAAGGLLRGRVSRLAALSEAAEGLGGPADFWSAMS
jgi:energy-coupling factor transporter ATP-binding protein EcfA2